VLVDGRRDREAFLELVRPLVEAGVGMIQLRDKTLDDCSLVERGELLVEWTRGTRSVAVINDRVDVAVACGARGVHLGQTDLTVQQARTVAGGRMWVGVSTHDIEQARRAVLAGASYLGIGPVFESRTKQFTQRAGLRYVSQVSEATSIPGFAIGGITLDNLDSVWDAGARRVAVGAAITAAPSPGAAAAAFLRRLQQLEDRAGTEATTRGASPR
jgi:thiamine-phosphate pyrophosphorylase